MCICQFSSLVELAQDTCVEPYGNSFFFLFILKLCQDAVQRERCIAVSIFAATSQTHSTLACKCLYSVYIWILFFFIFVLRLLLASKDVVQRMECAFIVYSLAEMSFWPHTQLKDYISGYQVVFPHYLQLLARLPFEIVEFWQLFRWPQKSLVLN